MFQLKYHLLFPKTQILFDDEDLTFSINKIRSRKPSVLYFILHCYRMNGEEILVENKPVFTSSRWVIGTVYDHYEEAIHINKEIIEETTHTQIELITLGVDSENPLYFTEIMLQEGDFNSYHTPSEVQKSVKINFLNNHYVNLHDKNGNYLQVIRPNKESFFTDKLTGAEITILAPHFEEESEVDSHISVFLESMNQTEQTINVLR